MRINPWRSLVIAFFVVNAASAAIEQLPQARAETHARRVQTPAQFFCQIFKTGCVKQTFAKKQKTHSTKKKTVSASKSTPVSPPLTPVSPPLPKPAVASTRPLPIPTPLPKPRDALLPKPRDALPVVEKQTASISSLPEVSAPSKPGISSVPSPLSSRDEEAFCRDQLQALGAVFAVPNHVETTGQCNVANPVQLKSVRTATGIVELPGRPLLKCNFALRFVGWLSDVAAPVVAGGAPAKLSALSTGPGYECRGRNGDTNAKISEHAFGNAIDIDGITLSNGNRVEIADVANEQHPMHRMLMALRISGCGYFSTVLGPGANAAHASHYHFDLALHGRSSNYRICE